MYLATVHMILYTRIYMYLPADMSVGSFSYVCTPVRYPPYGCLLICCVSVCVRSYLYERVNNYDASASMHQTHARYSLSLFYP